MRGRELLILVNAYHESASPSSCPASMRRRPGGCASTRRRGEHRPAGRRHRGRGRRSSLQGRSLAAPFEGRRAVDAAGFHFRKSWGAEPRRRWRAFPALGAGRSEDGAVVSQRRAMTCRCGRRAMAGSSSRPTRWLPDHGYAFVLADGRPVPDPAARAQVADVHGPARLVDPARLRLAHRRLARPPLGRDGHLRAPHRHILARRHVRGRAPEARPSGRDSASRRSS